MERIGRYEVWGPLGSGGTARVDLARMQGDAGFVQLVAMKRLLAKVDAAPDAAVRFHDEAMLSAHIHHPSVVRVLDVLRDGESLAVVYEFVFGLSLRQVLAKVGEEGVPTPFASRIVIDVLEGLHAAHTALDATGQPLHIVHRDISPANLLVDVNGLAKVIDFGLATATHRIAHTKPGDVHGTVQYMAPERLRGSQGEASCDVYSVATVLWEMLSGRRLFDAPEGELVWRILEGIVPPPGAGRGDVSSELAEIVLQGLAREPERRFSSARAFGQAIERAAPPAPPAALAKWIEYRWKDEFSALRERVNAALRGDRDSFDAGKTQASAPAADPRTMTLPPLNEPDDDDDDAGGTEVCPSPFADPSRTLIGEHGTMPFADDTWTEPVAPNDAPNATSAHVSNATLPLVPSGAPAHAPAPTTTPTSEQNAPSSSLPPAPNAPIPWPDNWPTPWSHRALPSAQRRALRWGLAGLAGIFVILVAWLGVKALGARGHDGGSDSTTAPNDAAAIEATSAPVPVSLATSDVTDADEATSPDASAPDAASEATSRGGRRNERRSAPPRKPVKR